MQVCVSLVLRLRVLICKHLLPRLFEYTPPQLPGAAWISPDTGTIVLAYGGWSFVQGGRARDRNRLPGITTGKSVSSTLLQGMLKHFTKCADGGRRQPLP